MQKRALFKNKWLGIALVVPQLVLVFTFFYWPAGQALYWAFTLQQAWGGGNVWVGLSNFEQILTDPDYWSSIIQSFIFSFATTAIALICALVLAVLVDRQLRGYKFYRTVLIWPYAIAAPALGLAFRFLLAPDAGVIAFINKIWPGIWNPTISGTDAMIGIVVAFSWKYVAYCFIFLLAALQSIPRSLLEAGAMDGAGVARRIRDIQLPLLTPTLFFLLVIMFTESFTDSFGIIDIMTSGGPSRATDLMVYNIYTDGFQGLDYSGAAAQSIILMIVVMVLTVVQFRFIERKVYYK